MKALPFLFLLVLCGCQTSHSVITTTGTVLGISIAENPSTALYEAKLGYARTEFAYVPSNRGTGTNASIGNGAKDTTDVLLEMSFQNILKGGGLYQRLAVGSVAVSQPGAAVMFAKDRNGNLDPLTAQVLAAKSAPTVEAAAVSQKVPLATAYRTSENKAAFDEVARMKGFDSFAAWLSSSKTTATEVSEMALTLKNANLLK